MACMGQPWRIHEVVQDFSASLKVFEQPCGNTSGQSLEDGGFGAVSELEKGTVPYCLCPQPFDLRQVRSLRVCEGNEVCVMQTVCLR